MLRYTHCIKLLFVTLLTFVVSQAQSQSVVNPKSVAVRGGLSGGIDVGIGSKKGYLNPSLTYFELTSLGRKESLLIGWTARLSALYGNDLDYYTAPSRLTRVQNIDTIRFNQVSQTSLNFGIRAEFNLGRVQIGASVDLLGFTMFGRARTGRVYSSTGLFSVKDSLDQTALKRFEGTDAYQQASPTRFNVKLLGDHERGMSTTEIYARAYFIPNVGLKLGYQWVTTEMALANPDQVANNNRFRNRAGLPYVALTFPLNPW